MKSMTGFGRSFDRVPSSSDQRREVAHDAKATKKRSPSRRSSSLSSSSSSPQPTTAVSGELDIAVKAVNGRYLDVRFHVPREYGGLEGEFKAILAETFKRGTLDVYINRSRVPPAKGSIRVNQDIAQAWLEGYRELGRKLKLKASKPSLDLISRLPDVFVVDQPLSVPEAELELAKRLLREAAQACDFERKREGVALARDLDLHCQRLEAIAEEAQGLKEAAKAELEKRTFSRLQDHLKKLGFEGKVDDQRIAQEIVISLDRVDIAEELQRLREHLRAYRELLKSPAPEGKKLDFYAQELLREVNTIGSKSHIASLTTLVVEAKTLVERIREQIQNVE